MSVFAAVGPTEFGRESTRLQRHITLSANKALHVVLCLKEVDKLVSRLNRKLTAYAFG